MSEIETQLRDYFDASVERVTPEDILARRRVTETIRPERPQRQLHPAWAAVGAFVATVVVLGGTIGLGAVVNGPNSGAVSDRFSAVMQDAADAAGGWWLLVAAIAVVIGLVGAVLVRNRQHPREHDQEEEDRMATTIEAPPAAETGTASRNNRGLIVTIVVLAVALLALGAWVLYSQTTEAETAAPAEVQELTDAYNTAWNAHDSEAFLELTTEYYQFVSGPMSQNQTTQAALVGKTGADQGFQVETIGELIVSGDQPYRVAMVNHVSNAGTAEPAEGISVLSVVGTPDGLKVSRHIWTES